MGPNVWWGDQGAWGQRQVVQCKCFGFTGYLVICPEICVFDCFWSGWICTTCSQECCFFVFQTFNVQLATLPNHKQAVTILEIWPWPGHPSSRNFHLEVDKVYRTEFPKRINRDGQSLHLVPGVFYPTLIIQEWRMVHGGAIQRTTFIYILLFKTYDRFRSVHWFLDTRCMFEADCMGWNPPNELSLRRLSNIAPAKSWFLFSGTFVLLKRSTLWWSCRYYDVFEVFYFW